RVADADHAESFSPIAGGGGPYIEGPIRVGCLPHKRQVAFRGVLHGAMTERSAIRHLGRDHGHRPGVSAVLRYGNLDGLSGMQPLRDLVGGVCDGKISMSRAESTAASGVFLGIHRVNYASRSGAVVRRSDISSGASHGCRRITGITLARKPGVNLRRRQGDW